MSAEAKRRARKLKRHRRRAFPLARQVDAAVRAGIRPADSNSLTYAYILRTTGKSLVEKADLILDDITPKPEGLANAFTYDGTLDELKAHNEEIKRRAAQEPQEPDWGQVPSAPIVRVTTISRPRERRPSCGRVRGSRRGRTRSTRAGPSSDDPDPDGSGPRRRGLRAELTRRPR